MSMVEFYEKSHSYVVIDIGIAFGQKLLESFNKYDFGSIMDEKEFLYCSYAYPLALYNSFYPKSKKSIDDISQFLMEKFLRISYIL